MFLFVTCNATFMGVLGLSSFLNLLFELFCFFFVLRDLVLFVLYLAAQLFYLLLHRVGTPLILLNLLGIDSKLFL